MNPLNDCPQAEWVQNHKKYEEMELTLSKGETLVQVFLNISQNSTFFTLPTQIHILVLNSKLVSPSSELIIL